MYGGRYSLTRYSLGAGEGTIEAGEGFSAALKGLAGGTVRIPAGEVFSGALGGTARGVLAVDASLDTRAQLLANGRLRADIAASVSLAAGLAGAGRLGKDLPAALEGSAALLGNVWASKDMPVPETFKSGLIVAAAGSKDLFGDLLAAAVLTTSAEPGIQSMDRAVFQLTIPPGGELRIDSGLYTVLLNGENALHTQEGDWVELTRSLARLTIECAQGGGLEGRLVYQERYL